MNPAIILLIIQAVNALATLAPLAVETIAKIKAALAEDPTFAQGFADLLSSADAANADTLAAIAAFRKEVNL
jgi:hypothetical protein